MTRDRRARKDGKHSGERRDLVYGVEVRGEREGATRLPQ